MSRVVINNAGIRELNEDKRLVPDFQRTANEVRVRVMAPAHLRLDTRAGVGPRGLFSQVMMVGPGAIAYEFGGRTISARAPLRRALGMLDRR